MRRISKVVIFSLIICLMLSGCAGEAPVSNEQIIVTTSLENKPVLIGNIPCEFPFADEPTQLNVLATGYDDMDLENVYVWKKYEEMSGIDVKWINVSKAQRAEVVNNALANKQNIDLIMRCKVSSNRLTQYGESGLILDLNKDDLLKNYAPNCWAYLQTHPEALASITNPDGSIYALPQVNSGPELRVSRKLFVNKNWLNNVDMELPTTIDELYDLLKAFKEQDANGNGDPHDEIPLCPLDWNSVQESLFGAFGLGNRGQQNQTVDFDEKTGKVRLIAASDGYKDYLKFLRKLFQEGLLDQNVFTINDEQWHAKAGSDSFGMFANTNLAWITADKVDDWVAIDEALEGPNGDKMWAAVRANFHSTGAALIPTTCNNPQLVLKWLDYFWTDEGSLFYHMGIEGETFVANEDGTYDYMPYIYEEMERDNKIFDDVVAKYTPYPGGGNPTVEIAPYFMGGEMASVPAEAARKLFEYGPEEYWPSFTFTAEDNDRLDVIKGDIEKYCETMKIGFITGNKPFSEWNEYLEQLNELKMDEMLRIYQTAVDRYYETKK